MCYFGLLNAGFRDVRHYDGKAKEKERLWNVVFWYKGVDVIWSLPILHRTNGLLLFSLQAIFCESLLQMESTSVHTPPLVRISTAS